MGIALDDMTEDNGALMVIPGSHKDKVWDHHQDGLFVGAVTDPTFQPDDAVSVTVKAGGSTLHHVRMVHGSKPNESEASSTTTTEAAASNGGAEDPPQLAHKNTAANSALATPIVRITPIPLSHTNQNIAETEASPTVVRVRCKGC